ncbi:MAG: 50S ribosomal protein L24 [Candidatus Wildermuthbacteria bacterium]|nr:50S ribosomal protein L24 [Candidatus Wildermuthbacteria bacterium]
MIAKLKIKKGDTVLMISGKDRGKTGKVIRAFPQSGRILVEGVQIRKKHIRPRRSGEKGQVVQQPSPVAISNVKLLCPKCGKPARVGYRVEANTKHRVCKECKSVL